MRKEELKTILVIILLFLILFILIPLTIYSTGGALESTNYYNRPLSIILTNMT